MNMVTRKIYACTRLDNHPQCTWGVTGFFSCLCTRVSTLMAWGSPPTKRAWQFVNSGFPVISLHLMTFLVPIHEHPFHFFNCNRDIRIVTLHLSLPFTAKAPVSISNIATCRVSEKIVLNLSVKCYNSISQYIIHKIQE